MNVHPSLGGAEIPGNFPVMVAPLTPSVPPSGGVSDRRRFPPCGRALAVGSAPAGEMTCYLVMMVVLIRSSTREGIMKKTINLLGYRYSLVIKLEVYRGLSKKRRQEIKTMVDEQISPSEKGRQVGRMKLIRMSIQPNLGFQDVRDLASELWPEHTRPWY